ncbi:hypothetical protein ACFLVS_07250 [Chloroflexota bacterium]
MKCNKLFRTLGIAIVLCLLVIAIPATPALAQSIYCSPGTGTAGTTVTVTGSTFTASTYAYVFFDYDYQTSAPIDIYGNFTASFSIPTSATAGTHYVTVDDSPTWDGTGLATAYFTVTENEIVISPSSGYVGDQITVSSSGFSATSSVTIYFETTVLGTATTDAYGNFTSALFTIPESYWGSHTIKAQGTSGTYATAIFTVLPKITITPASGAIGDTATIHCQFRNNLLL